MSPPAHSLDSERYDVSLWQTSDYTIPVNFVKIPAPSADPVLRNGHIFQDAERHAIAGAIENMSHKREALQKELQALGAPTERLRHAIDTLDDALKSYAAYIAPVRRLPVELLAEIMDLACAEESHLRAEFCQPLALSAVSRSWRDTMLSYPRAWTRWSTENMNPWTEHAEVQDVMLPRLRVFLERSGSHPLTQEIGFYPSDPSEALNLLLRPLLDHTDRWQNISFTQMLQNDRGLDFSALEGKPLPLLKSLSGPALPLELAAASGVFRGFPTLRHVGLYNRNASKIVPNLPWAQLQTLSIGSHSIKYPLEVLRKCLNLRSWTYRCMDLDDDEAPPDMTVLHMPTVLEIEIDMAFDKRDSLLCCITAPSLQVLTLRWYCPKIQQTDLQGPLPHFMERSSCPLRKLTLDQWPYKAFAGLDSVTFPHLEELCLMGARLPVTNEFMDLLACCDQFPRLEKLEVGDCIEADNVAFIELAKARKAGGRPLQALIVKITDMTWNAHRFDEESWRAQMQALVPTFSICDRLRNARYY
ncbi:hypothetical protein EV122DRAFT_258738 [Schizophyllum commune]